MYLKKTVNRGKTASKMLKSGWLIMKKMLIF